MVWVARIFFCIFVIGFCLYGAINHQNRITQLRMEVPALGKEVKMLREKNRKLRYEVDRFEDLTNLLNLMKQPEFGHLHYPHYDAVIVLEKESL